MYLFAHSSICVHFCLVEYSHFGLCFPAYLHAWLIARRCVIYLVGSWIFFYSEYCIVWICHTSSILLLVGIWIVFNFWQSLRALLEYSSTCALVNEHVYGFSFSMYTWECNCWVIGYSYVQPHYILPNSFIKQLCQFVFLPGVYANSACSQLTSTWYFSMFIRATFYFNLRLSNLGNWAYFHKYFSI